MGGVDSCYSWVVAFASCLIFLLVSFPVRLGAQLFVSLLNRYETTRKEASFPFVLALVVRSLSGPFAGVLGEIVGLQGVTILGCLICSVGVGVCFFAEDVLTITICLGIIYGIGYGWSNALVPEILNHYFKKHRSKAYGIYLSGAALGSFLVPPILDFFLKDFGVSGTFLIMAAIILNAIPAAMILTVPKSERRIKHRLLSSNAKPKSKVSYDTENGPKTFCVKSINSSVDNKSENDCEINNKLSTNYSNEAYEYHLKNCKVNLNKESHVKAMDLRYEKVVVTYKNLNENHENNSEFKLETDFSTSDGRFKKFKKSILSTLTVLCGPEFLAIALLHAVNSYMNQVFWTITIDFVRDKGIEKYLEVYFVMCLSLFDTIGRFVLGSIPDKGLMTIRNFSIFCTAVTGFIFMLLTWLPEFFSLITTFALMGLAFGGNTIAMPGLITQFVEEEKRAIAMASRLIATAPVCLTIPPLIGLFRGSLGSYDGLLYLMTSMSIVCIVLLVLLPVLKKRRNRNRMKNNR